MLAYLLSAALLFSPIESRPGAREPGSSRLLWTPWALADVAAAGFDAAAVERALFSEAVPSAQGPFFLWSRWHKRLGWGVEQTSTARIYALLRVERGEEGLLLVLYSRGSPDAIVEEGLGASLSVALVDAKVRLAASGAFQLRAAGPTAENPEPARLGNVLSADLEVRGKRAFAVVRYENSHSPGGEALAQEWRIRIEVVGERRPRLRTSVARVE